jgi:Xaa-Pro aminopeptidase
MLVNTQENRRYLSGFTGSNAFLVILPQRAYLCTDFRYLEQAALQAPDFEVVQLERPWTKTIGALLTRGSCPVAFESEHLSYDTYVELLRGIPDVEFRPQKGLIEALRMVKDADEVKLLREAIKMTDRGVDFLRSYLKPGLTEQEVALELEFFLRRLGANGPAFSFIVASGTRSSLPHAEPTERRLEVGDLLTIDFGAVYKGYHSDLTRTFVFGEPTAKQRSLYDLVLEAQIAGIEAAQPGVPVAEVDRAARSVIEQRGHGEHFGHSLGHGVGLAIHEGPHLSAECPEVLQPGMVVTVEPGVYIPGFGGVRTEDIILVTTTGNEILSQAPKHSFIL